MRKIIYHVAVSIDGFIADLDQQPNQFLTEGKHVEDFYKSIEAYDSVLMGTQTYSYGFQFGLKPGQAAYPNLKHYIVTQSLTFKDTDQVKKIATKAIEEIQHLKEQQGKPIWLCGGGKLAQHLYQHHLIDEIVLKVNPILLGNGIPVFASSNSYSNPKLTLLNQKQYDNGVLLIHYKI